MKSEACTDLRVHIKAKKISVQGTGMGVPSISIYVNELIQSYDVQNLIRVGSCGAIRKDVKVRDVILAMTSSTDSQMNRVAFGSIDFAPCADFELLKMPMMPQRIKACR